MAKVGLQGGTPPPQYYDESTLIADVSDGVSQIGFEGAGVTAAFNSTTKKVTVTIPGGGGGSTPTGTGFRHVTSGTEDGAAKTVDTADITNAAVTLTKLANLAANAILGNNTGSPATPIALTAAQVKALLAIAAGDVSGLAAVATSGSASDLGTGTLPIARIADGDVTLAKMENLANGKIIGRNTAGTGVPEALTTLPTAAMPALTGDVTNSAGALATTIANDAVTNAKLANMATATFKGRTTAGTGDPEDLSVAQAAALLAGTSGSTLCVGNDSRLSDSRAPTGSAGGDLAGTYPNPTIKDRSTATKSSNYTLVLTDGAIQATATCTLTLPDATTCAGKSYFISNEGSAWSVVVTLKSNGGTVDGVAAATGIKLFKGDVYVVMSDGTNWVVVHRPGRTRLVFSILSQLSHTGTVSETTKATSTIPAGLLKVGSLIQMFACFSAAAANSNTKTFRMRDASNTILAAVSQTSTSQSTTIRKNYIISDSTHMVYNPSGVAEVSGSTGQVVSTTVDLTNDVVWNWNLLLGNTGDTITLDYGWLLISEPA